MERYGQNERVSLTISDAIAEIRLEHPEKRNAFSLELGEDFAELIDVVRKRDDVHVILVTAEGPVFSAGADVDVLTEGTPEERERLLSVILDDVCHPLHRTSVPVVAAARGSAAGGGATLLCYSADLQVVAPETEIWWPEVEFGTAPLGRAVYLTHTIGSPRALELMALGEEGKISAREAQQLGLIARTADHDEVEETARDIATTLSTYNRKYDGIIDAFVDVVDRAREESVGISMDYAHFRENEFK